LNGATIFSEKPRQLRVYAAVPGLTSAHFPPNSQRVSRKIILRGAPASTFFCAGRHAAFNRRPAF
jgi:hypothetical protein